MVIFHLFSDQPPMKEKKKSPTCGLNGPKDPEPLRSMRELQITRT